MSSSGDAEEISDLGHDGKVPSSASSKSEQTVQNFGDVFQRVLRTELRGLEDRILGEFAIVHTRLGELSQRMEVLESAPAGLGLREEAGSRRYARKLGDSAVLMESDGSVHGALVTQEVADPTSGVLDESKVAPAEAPFTPTRARKNLRKFTNGKSGELLLEPLTTAQVVGSLLSQDKGRVLKDALTIRDKTILCGVATHLAHRQYTYQIENATGVPIQVEVYRKARVVKLGLGKSEGAKILPGGRWNFASAWSSLCAVVEEEDGTKQRFPRLRRYVPPIFGPGHFSYTPRYAPGDEVSFYRLGKGGGVGERQLYISSHLEHPTMSKAKTAPNIHVYDWGASDSADKLNGWKRRSSSEQWRQSRSGKNATASVSSSDSSDLLSSGESRRGSLPRTSSRNGRERSRSRGRSREAESLRREKNSERKGAEGRRRSQGKAVVESSDGKGSTNRGRSRETDSLWREQAVEESSDWLSSDGER